MSYEYLKAHKTEDWVAREMFECVCESIIHHFGVEDPNDLTVEQMDEVVHYRENVLNEYSPIQMGFSDVIGMWENAQWEKENEREG